VVLPGVAHGGLLRAKWYGTPAWWWQWWCPPLSSPKTEADTSGQGAGLHESGAVARLTARGRSAGLVRRTWCKN